MASKEQTEENTGVKCLCEEPLLSTDVSNLLKFWKTRKIPHLDLLKKAGGADGKDENGNVWLCIFPQCQFYCSAREKLEAHSQESDHQPVKRNSVQLRNIHHTNLILMKDSKGEPATLPCEFTKDGCGSLIAKCNCGKEDLYVFMLGLTDTVDKYIPTNQVPEDEEIIIHTNPSTSGVKNSALPKATKEVTSNKLQEPAKKKSASLKPAATAIVRAKKSAGGFSCKMCADAGADATPANKRYHSLSHMVPIWGCSECDRVQTRSHDIKRHIEIAHPKAKKAEPKMIISEEEFQSLSNTLLDMCFGDLPVDFSFPGVKKNQRVRKRSSESPAAVGPDAKKRKKEKF